MSENEQQQLGQILEDKDENKKWKYIKGNKIYQQQKITKIQIDGKETTNTQQIKQHIKQYWEEIGGVGTEKSTNIQINIEQKTINTEQNYKITKQEMIDYTKKLKPMKAIGYDNIPNEFYTQGGDKIHTAL